MNRRLEEIKQRAERGYTMAIYGTRDNLHGQMADDIDTLIRMLGEKLPIQNVVCSALPDDYPTKEECDKIEEEYRQAHWCSRCLAMFEEECICDYDEDE